MPALTPPLVIVNYKVYPSTIGDRALELTRSLERAAERFPDATVAVCPGHAELARVAEATDLVVLAQSVSGQAPGSGTGRVLVESIEAAGADGSLINHAECPLPADEVQAAVERLREAGLESVVCAADEAAVRELTALRPDYVAVEPPELIGGDVSVTTVDPGIIARSVEAAREVDAEAQLLCGAGVKRGTDVAAALELGTLGVLVASGVAKADDPGAALADLLEGTVGKE